MKYTMSSKNRTHHLKKASVPDFTGASSWQESQSDAVFIFLIDVYLCIYSALYRIFRNLLIYPILLDSTSLISFQKVLRNPFSGISYDD